MGMLLQDSTPPSGPMWLDSCLILDTTAKYCGKSLVMMRQMRFFSNSSGLSSSVLKKKHFHVCHLMTYSVTNVTYCL